MTQLQKIVVEATRGAKPLASAAVAIIAVDGDVAAEAAAGVTRWVSDPHAPATAVDVDTRFDLASITKMFTAAALLTCLDERGLSESTRVAEVLSEFEHGISRTVTFADLLRHTAGMAAEWKDRSRDSDARSRFRTTRPEAVAGSRYLYSCVGYIWAGLAAEALTGDRLDAVIDRVVLTPLELGKTGFTPSQSERNSIAATEFQTEPDRGVVQGEVHDETAWVLGGISGNSGMFGTAGDLLKFFEMIRREGYHRGRRVLPERVIAAMSTDRLPAELARRPAYGQALGPRIGDASWMGALAQRGAIGHTGFTGTSALTIPGGAHSVIILTNRVHPSRHGIDPAALRRRIADDAAQI